VGLDDDAGAGVTGAGAVVEVKHIMLVRDKSHIFGGGLHILTRASYALKRL
jgi:hypothetical protein